MIRSSLLPLVLLILLGNRLIPQASAQPVERSDEEESSADRLDVGATLIASLIADDLEGKPANRFELEMARIRMDWSWEKLLAARVQFDVDGLVDAGEALSLLRDCWAEVSPARWLKFRAGQFKRPFSRLELRGRSRLEVVRRGPSNDFLISDLGFGERDLGFQVSGRLGGKKRNLEYFLGAFNGNGKNERETDLDGTKDLVARLEGKPAKWLSLGAGASFKFWDTESVAYFPAWSWMGGLDAELRRKKLTVLAEGLTGLNHDRCAYAADSSACRLNPPAGEIPLAWSAMMMAFYRFDLTGDGVVALQPVVKGEWLVPDSSLTSGQVVTATGGINLLLADRWRLMVQGDLVMPGDGAPKEWPERNRLWLAVSCLL